jgi:spore maturation protein CgeB
LYCSVDPEMYVEDSAAIKDRDLGYLGTYSEDRQPAVDELLVTPARAWPAGRFVMAGPQYPDSVTTPGNVERIVHLAPGEHRAFYNRLRFTLNVTRRSMVDAGYSPSVRLFEAAACGTPIISDDWPGLSTILTPGREILLAHNAGEVLAYLRELPERERARIGAAGRSRVLQSHTSLHRAIELEQYVAEVRNVTDTVAVAGPNVGARFA